MVITPVSPVSGYPNLLLGAYDLATLGYGAEEFFVSETASSCANFAKADYTTRIVVLTPTDDAKFNGTVIVEWLNVSGGIDAPAVWLWPIARSCATAMPMSRSPRSVLASRVEQVSSAPTCRSKPRIPNAIRA